MSDDEIRELAAILGKRTPTSMTLARMVIDLNRQLTDTRQRLAWHDREAYRLRRAAAASDRLRAKLDAKSTALEFSIQRCEVLRRHLSEALGGKAYRTAYELQKRRRATHSGDTVEV